MRIEIINPQHLARLLMVFGLLVFANAPAGTKDFALHQAVLDNDKQLVTRLLNKGAAINVIGSRKYGYGSALHLAVREGHLEIARLLLDRGAEVDVLDPDDFTPLHNAAWNGNLEMTELLLDAGADIEASTYDGDTPLTLAQNNDQAQVAAFIQAKLQPSATSEVKVESVATNDTGVIDISGTYINTELTYPRLIPRHYHSYFFGDGSNLKVTIKQSGNAITGVISGNSTGEFKGVIKGREITFESSMSSSLGPVLSSGNGIWLVSNDGDALTGSYRLYSTSFGSTIGNWGYGDLIGNWNFRKIESTAASDSGIRDVSGTYVMTNLTGNWGLDEFLSSPRSKDVNEITIVQNGDQLTGTHSEGRGKLWGVIKGDTIKFDWAGKRHTGRGEWTFKPGSNESSVTLHTNSGSGEAKFNLTKIETTPSATDSGAINISGTYISEITVSSIGGYGPSHYAKTFMKKKNRKEITLEQTGNAISGVDSPKNPKINGTREGNTINFYILVGDQINGTWEINADATEMVGKWSTDGGGGASGKWNLTRVK